MRTLAVGLWKEWRDHRLVSLALLVALPVLVFVSAWAFRDDVGPADFGGLTLFALCAAQALYVFSVASESFGGERRRGTLDFLRRLPRGLPRAFAAKHTMYVLGTMCALAWGALVAWLACQWFGPERAVGDFAKALLLPDPMIAVVTTAVFALGLWTLLVSNMIPQGGAATVGAAILLGLLGVPAFLAIKDHPWVLGMPGPQLLLPASALLAVPALLALAYAFLCGNRLLASAWSPSWRGLAVVSVLACGGYACGAVELQRALTIDPLADGFRIEHAYLGKGGRHLFLLVQRDTCCDSIPWGADARTPYQPWIVDLESGGWRAAGDFGDDWAALAWNNRHVPQPILRRFSSGGDVGWFDGETGVLRKVLPYDVRTQDVLEWQRASMPAVAWHRDASGGAVWLEDQHVVREGMDAPLPRWIPGKPEAYTWPIPGGWYAPAMVNDNPRRIPTAVWRLWDAATGKVSTAERSPGRTHNEMLLSPHTALRLSSRPAPKGTKATLEPWTLVDLQSGTVSPTKNPPETERLLAALPGERALFLAGTDKARLVLSAWDPRSGEVTPVLDDKGQPFVGYGAEMAGSAPSDLSVVKVWNDRAHPLSVSIALLDEATGRALRLPLLDERFEVVCIESRDSVVTLDFSREVNRWTYSTHRVGLPPGFSVRTLFPLPGKE